ncbi:MAG: aminotransferase class I/II-fold pyridoxal phosphate-dependent enzyme, partial [Candidatus Electrothrix sp. ATG2]|nr:aminotransferase class I/II-fold pyridoxal phosphate-dependent enzyme [Candidatus Electrothrix sp. ATG2]
SIDEKLAAKLAEWGVHYLVSIDGYGERHNMSRPARFTEDPFEDDVAFCKLLQEVSVDASIYEQRRKVFCDVLDKAGLEYVVPKGAFYLFPKTPIEDDVAFCKLLQEEKILAVPGRGFGTPGHIRLAFCVDEEVIAKSADGFQRAVAKAKGEG